MLSLIFGGRPAVFKTAEHFFSIFIFEQRVKQNNLDNKKNVSLFITINKKNTQGVIYL